MTADSDDGRSGPATDRVVVLAYVSVILVAVYQAVIFFPRAPLVPWGALVVLASAFLVTAAVWRIRARLG